MGPVRPRLNPPLYDKLLEWFGLSRTLESRRIQAIPLITVIQGRAPASSSKLIEGGNTSYNLRGENVLSVPEVNSTRCRLNPWWYSTV